VISSGNGRETRKIPPEVFRLISGFDTANLCDGMKTPNIMNSGIKPVSSEWKIAGQALTVRLPAGDSLMTFLALELAQEGDVLVIDAGGLADNAVWGDMKSLAAKCRRISGIVLDGAVRDPAGIRNAGVPVFARYVTCRASSKNTPGEINTTIHCGGAAVHPGDVVVGDEGGVVVIPLRELEDVLARTKEKVDSDEQARERIQRGDVMPENIRRQLKAFGFFPDEY